MNHVVKFNRKIFYNNIVQSRICFVHDFDFPIITLIFFPQQPSCIAPDRWRSKYKFNNYIVHNLMKELNLMHAGERVYNNDDNIAIGQDWHKSLMWQIFIFLRCSQFF